MTGEKKIVGLWRDSAAKPEADDAGNAAPAEAAAPESVSQPEVAAPQERDWLDMSALAGTDETEFADDADDADASGARDRIVPALLILLGFGWAVFATYAATGGFARAIS